MNIELTAPINYSELTEKQLRYVAALQVAGNSEMQIWSKCLLKFSGLQPVVGNETKYYFKKKNVKQIFEVEIEDLLSFANALRFLTKSYKGINPLAKLKSFVPCSSLLEDVKFNQYLEAENYYQAYMFTKDETFLHGLMATLYGRKGKPYNNEMTDIKAKSLSKCSREEKLICFMWFMGVKEFFASKYKFLFAGGTTELEEGEEPQAPDMYAIIQNQVRALTDGDITKREGVLNALTWDALDELNQKIKEAKQLQTTN